MKIYLAIKFHSDFSNRKLIEDILLIFEKTGHETTVAVRDFENWGAIKLSNKEIMTRAFESIKNSDLLIVECSEKGVGLGLVIGYAKGINKKVIVIAKTGTEISDTIEGTADKIIFYDHVDDLQETFNIS